MISLHESVKSFRRFSKNLYGYEIMAAARLNRKERPSFLNAVFFQFFIRNCEDSFFCSWGIISDFQTTATLISEVHKDSWWFFEFTNRIRSQMKCTRVDVSDSITIQNNRQIAVVAARTFKASFGASFFALLSSMGLLFLLDYCIYFSDGISHGLKAGTLTTAVIIALSHTSKQLFGSVFQSLRVAVVRALQT